MWTWPRAVDKWIDIELAREEEVDGRTYPSALRSSPVPPCLASLSPHRSPASPPSSSRPPQASDECIKLIVDSFPFHSLHSRRHTLGLAWCRSGTDQSGFGSRRLIRSALPPALAGLLPHLHQVNSRILGEKGRWAFLRDMQLLGHIQSKNKLSLLLSADSIYKHRGILSWETKKLYMLTSNWTL
ncbi:hypothetical protein OPV22_009186 [Ensete ventricosum]|uniref:Uncharacterized protein n=1 Tax=Ensete ventricosum TaxID=4639 RepID=A0AAV8RA66_ENSVE|nr:hypothetical protein OPV22_009186 [Ensete ventricosum]